MDANLTSLSATNLLEQLVRGDVTAEAVVSEHCDRIATVDNSLRSFLRVDRDNALSQARDIDRRRRSGERLGTLAGLPLSVKDNLCDRETTTTCASRILGRFEPPYDATVITRLKDAGAVLIGRTNLDEFAMGGSTEYSASGPTRNPWHQDHVPGGSSGGAAASVAAGLAPLAIGSDTGGSIRQPAAYCGVCGLKPTYGRVSRYGLVAFASSLDQIGPLARTAEDLALLLEAIAGYDPRDSTSADELVPDYRAALNQPLEGIRIGWLARQLEQGVEADVADSLEEARHTFESLGAKFVELDLPHLQYGVATYYLIAPSEASSNLARYDGVHYGTRVEGSAEEIERDGALVAMYRATRSDGFGREVKRRIMLGTYALSAGYYDAFYLKALKVRRMIRDDYFRAFDRVDLLMGPTTPTPAFRIGELTTDPLNLYLQDLFTVTANLAGVPAISIPCGMTANAPSLPIGMQLQAPPFAEEQLLRAAHQYQQATDWHAQRPPLP